jgi:hypothetical protein
MNFLQAIVIACLCVVPQSTVLRESVNAIERNYLYNEHGQLVFEQVIFCDIVDGEEQVVAWRLIKDPAIVPKRDWQGGWVATWVDADIVRQVRTGSVRESWTQYDPELIAREKLPNEKRRGLTNRSE